MTEWTRVLDQVSAHGTQAGEGQTLLWLHGYSSETDESPFINRLGRHYRVLAPQHPGFGSTERGFIRTMEDLALWYRHLLSEEAAGQRVVLAGHSLGGWIAAEFAYRFPHLIDRLVLVAPMGLRLPDTPFADIFMLTDGARRELEWTDDATRPTAPDQPTLAGIHDAEMTAQLAWEPRLFAPRLAERLRWIDAPTTVVWGAGDQIVPPAYADHWVAHLPDATAHIIAGAGHYVHLERPDACLDVIVRSAAESSTHEPVRA